MFPYQMVTNGSMAQFLPSYGLMGIARGQGLQETFHLPFHIVLRNIAGEHGEAHQDT